MDITEALCCAVIASIVSVVMLHEVGMRMWSCIVLSLALGVGVLTFLYPVSKLLKCGMTNGVIVYISSIIFVFLFCLIYLVIRCALDFP